MFKCSKCGKFSISAAANKDGLCSMCEISACELNIDEALLERNKKIADEVAEDLAKANAARSINAPGALLLQLKGNKILAALGSNIIVDKKGIETVYPIAQMKSFEVGVGSITIKLGMPSTGALVIAGMVANVGSDEIFFFAGEHTDAAMKIRNYVRDFQQSAPPQAANSAAEELRQFKSLLDDGIINQDEFDAKKKQLLGL